MKKRRGRGFSGTPAEHRARAEDWFEETREKLQEARRSGNDCNRTYIFLKSALDAQGRMRAEFEWDKKAPYATREKMRRQAQQLDDLVWDFQAKCVGPRTTKGGR